jgi:hypothetical protein
MVSNTSAAFYPNYKTVKNEGAYLKVWYQGSGSPPDSYPGAADAMEADLTRRYPV